MTDLVHVQNAPHLFVEVLELSQEFVAFVEQVKVRSHAPLHEAELVEEETAALERRHRVQVLHRVHRHRNHATNDEQRVNFKLVWQPPYFDIHKPFCAAASVGHAEAIANFQFLFLCASTSAALT